MSCREITRSQNIQGRCLDSKTNTFFLTDSDYNFTLIKETNKKEWTNKKEQRNKK